MREFSFLLAVVLTTLAVISCAGENAVSGERTITVEENSPVAALSSSKFFYHAKSAYEIDMEKSMLVTYEPVCREQGDSLYWSLKGEKRIATYKFHSQQKKVSLDFGKEKHTLHYEGNVFPFGKWKDTASTDGVVKGFALDDAGVISRSSFFETSCAISNLKSFRFFETFFGDGNFTAEDCEVAISSHGYAVKVENVVENEIDILVLKDKERCALSLSPRFAVNKSDCEAAYAEYKQGNGGEAFSFEDYNLEISGDTECFVNLMKSL